MYPNSFFKFDLGLKDISLWILIGSILTAFGLGFWIATLFWHRRKKRVLKNLELLISAEKSEYIPLDNPNSKDIEDGFRTLIIARKQELQRLQQLETYRRDYIGNIAHELKTPLFSIQGYIETIMDDPDLDVTTRESFLKKANKNATRLGQIVKDLDAITKYESGVLKIEKEPFDLLQLIQNIVEEMEIQASAKQISIFLQNRTENAIVNADKEMIHQVLSNLGYNSIKYGRPQGNTTYKISDTGKKIIVEVSDNGIGIPTKDIGRIFERFFRVDTHRSRESGGSGLGLSICKHIIEAHNETINVISTEGAGSTFSFSLEKHLEE